MTAKRHHEQLLEKLTYIELDMMGTPNTNNITSGWRNYAPLNIDVIEIQNELQVCYITGR